MKPLKKPLKKSAEILITYFFAFYKMALRPFFGNACKFQPTCSCYSQEAFSNHGIVKGFTLTTWRLLRCHPFGDGGFDPVPQKLEANNGR